MNKKNLLLPKMMCDLLKERRRSMFKFLKYCSYIIVLLGALNWGSVGVFEFNLVSYLLGCKTRGSRVVYSIIGLNAIISAIAATLCCLNKAKEKENEAVPVALNI